MKTDNFLPLKARWPQLYEHACFAERYVFSDPHASAVKLRCFVEALVGILYRELKLHSEPGDGFFERLKSPGLREVVGEAVLQKLHAIRILGNKAAHGEAIEDDTSLALVEEAYLIGQWFYKTCSEGAVEDYPAFVAPTKFASDRLDLTDSNAQLAKQLTEANEELSRLEAEQQAAQAEIASLNKQALDENRILDFKNASARAAQTMDFKSENTRKLISVQDAFAGYSLTNGQGELINRLDRFLNSNDEDVFLLKGYAGTGKTFITKGLTEYFRAIGRNYVLAAPTGKASKVIARKTQSEAFTIHKTIYSFDDIAEYREDDTDGTETFKFYAKLAVNSLSADTVYIIDEASMIPDVYQEAEFFRFGSGFLLADLLKYVSLDHNDHSKKIIFIGDDAQLPPVGMNFSPALDASYLRRKHQAHAMEYELSEVVRQKAESGVIANAIPIRESLQAKVFNTLAIDCEHPDLEEVSHQDLMSRYLDACGGKINGEAIVIAHSNSDVGDYNQRIREHFFPGCQEVMPGDKVMAVSNGNVGGLFISNGDFGLIREVLSKTEKRTITLKRKLKESGEIEEIPVELTFRDVVVGFRDLDGSARFFQTKIVEHLLYTKEAALSSDENKALYLDFCIRHNGMERNSTEFKHTLKTDPYFNAMKLKFGYAITCHKAQGSEWNHVFVKCRSHQSQLTADYFRWLYTAITRTAQKLYLLDPPNLQPWSGIKMVSSPALEMLGAQQRPDAASPMPHDSPHVSAPLDVDETATFGIPESAPFLLSILAEVRRLVDGSGILIEDVRHNQYQEAYHFRRGTESARVDIAYNGKNKVSGISGSHLEGLGADVVALLAPLKGQALVSGACPMDQGVCFEKPFLNDFYKRVRDLCDERGIVVQDVVEQQWSQRYRFAKDGEVAVFDVYYNGKDKFTKCQPLITACSPGALTGDVGELLTKGLQG